MAVTCVKRIFLNEILWIFIRILMTLAHKVGSGNVFELNRWKAINGNNVTEFRDATFQRNVLSWSLRRRHNDHDGVSNHQPHHCLLNCLFGRRSKKTSKLRVTGLCAGNSPGTGEFPAKMASNVENISIWWRHHDIGHNDLTRQLKMNCLQN